jgi:hypothetical protein
MTMPPDGRLILDVGAAQWRRQLSPSAWVVLEELATQSAGAEISTSVRGLAPAVGLANDTTARALNRLIAAGLIDRRETRDRAGHFASAVYRVHLECAGLVMVDAPTESEPYFQPTRLEPAPRLREPRQRSSNHQQLDLFTA